MIMIYNRKQALNLIPRVINQISTIQREITKLSPTKFKRIQLQILIDKYENWEGIKGSECTVLLD